MPELKIGVLVISYLRRISRKSGEDRSGAPRRQIIASSVGPTGEALGMVLRS